MMFDKDNMQKHIGSEIKYRDNLLALKEVERFFRNECSKVGIEVSHDVTANENTYFKTLNYTMFSGLFIMHPLSYAPTMFQMYDALAENRPHDGHINFIMERIKNMEQGKYIKSDGSEMDGYDGGDFTHLVVLCGMNKFGPHVCKKKMELLCNDLGRKLLVKPHPVSQDLPDEFKKMVVEKASVAEPHHDLYDLIRRSEMVFTTHISETALASLIMGKKISPIDTFDMRLTGSFSHINHFCFSYPDGVEKLGKIFASAKSGVVHPEIDEDWKGKIMSYIQYAMTMRELQKNHYSH